MKPTQIKDKVNLKRKRHERDRFESSAEERTGNYTSPFKRRRSLHVYNTENVSKNISKCDKEVKMVMPKKLIDHTYHDLNSKKFLEKFKKLTVNAKNSKVSRELKSSNNDEKNVFKQYQQSITPKQASKTQAIVQKNLTSKALFSSSYISNPFEKPQNFQELFYNECSYPVLHDDIYKQENAFNRNKLPALKNKSTAEFKPFVPNEKIPELGEKELYKMIVDKCAKSSEFFLKNTPAMKNFEECTDKLSKLNFEKKVGEVLTVKKTSNISDIIFFDDDDPFVLDVKPSIRNYAKRHQKVKAHTPEWMKEFGKDMADVVEKTHAFMNQKKHYIKIYQERRAKKWRNDLQNLSDLSLSPDIIKAFNLTKKLVLPELSAEMNAVIDEALSFHSQNAVVSQTPKYSILYKDIETLVGLNWLNDEIINTYLELIKIRSKQPDYPSVHVFSSFFYPKLKSSGYSAVRRWTRKDDIFSYDINLVPLHLGMHWCLAVIDHRYKKIQYYDSLNSKEKCTTILKDYLVQEHLDKKKKPFDPNGWILENMENIPQQNNGSDCGMFTLKYAEYVTRNAKINFTQTNMPYFRRKMVYEVVTGRLV